MTNLDELFKKLEYYDHLRNTSRMTITQIPKPRNPRKVGRALTGKKRNGPGKFLERFSNFLEKNLIILISVFIFSILILNIFLTLILVIKYL